MTSNSNKAKIAADQDFIDRMAMEADIVSAETEDTIEYVDPDRFIIKLKNSKQFNHHEFAQWILNESGERFATIEGSSEIYYYKDGIYVQGGNTLIGKLLNHVMVSNYANIKNQGEVAQHIRMNTTVNRDAFDADMDVINMTNGLYHIDESRFEPHTPNYLSLSKTHVKYNVDASCPAIDKFIRETVEPHRVDAIYEINGYTQLPRKTLKRAVIFVGVSDTGKSTMISLISAMTGESRICDILPTGLASNSHATYGIYGKVLDRVDDLGTTSITDAGLLKSLISCKPVSANPKYGAAFSFSPNVLMMFGCNQVPKCDDQYLMDKFDILMFNNQHANDEVNLDLFEELTTDDEMSGFFNKSMNAVKTAIKNKTFTGSYTMDDRRGVYECLSEPIARFVAEECDLSDPNEMIEKKIFRKAYVEWSKDNNLKVCGVGEQTTYLQDRGVMLSRPGNEDRVEIYTGVCLSTQDTVTKPSQKNNDEKQDTDSDSELPSWGLLHSLSNEKQKNISTRVRIGQNTRRDPSKQCADSEKTQIRNLTEPDGFVTVDSCAPTDSDYDSEIGDRIKKAIKELCDGSDVTRDGYTVDQIEQRVRGLAKKTIHKYLTLFKDDIGVYMVSDGIWSVR